MLGKRLSFGVVDIDIAVVCRIQKTMRDQRIQGAWLGGQRVEDRVLAPVDLFLECVQQFQELRRSVMTPL